MLPTVDHAAHAGQEARRVGSSTPASALAKAMPRLLRHRACGAEDRQLVLSTCIYDRQVLPRYHQDDRGRGAQARYGHHELAPPGSYSRIHAWQGRQQWILAALIAFELRPDLVDEHSLTRDTLRQICVVKSGYADPHTGRQCIVRPDTIASVVGVQRDTVYRYQRFLRAVGLERVVQPGRMLTRSEKLALWHAGIRGRGFGSRQRGLSTEVALTVPRRLRAHLCHTPGSTSREEALNLTQPYRHPDGRAKAEPAPPALRSKMRRTRGRTPARSLAKHLKSQVDWLSGESVARLTPPLARFAAATPAWNAQDVVDALGDARRRAGLHSPITPEAIRTRPVVMLAHWLRRLDPELDHPRLPHMTPEELRCGRPECDHGWIPADPAALRVHELLGTPAPPVRRCDRCRPGAWPHDDEHLVEPDPFDEPPF